MDVKSILEKQRKFFADGNTLDVDFRINQLRRLKSLIEDNQEKIVAALYQDLRRTASETFINEVIAVNEEINFILKYLKKWARPQKVHTPFPLMFPGKSTIHYQPRGTSLVIGPWNYPFLLMMSPLMGSMSAGNTTILKPSELAPHTQDLVVELIAQYFSEDYVATVTGDPQVVTALLEERYDYIFFTGGTQIGKIVMQAAAKHLTPLTLELGGKSPCIVDQSAKLAYAARRIMWAKMTNAGQTCIAPDYLYVHKNCKDELIRLFKETLITYYGNDPASSNDFDRIINKKHFDRLSRFLNKGNIILGGETNPDTLYIAPTLIDGVSWNDPIMQEEIFGPILPILTFDSIDEVIANINAHEKPLSLYLFTRGKQIENEILERVSFGGGCINDCLMQVANPSLPFGGVGSSGLGAYHGKYSFESFSHRKSIYKRTPQLDVRLEYPPYTKRKLYWLQRLLKL